MIAVAAQKVIAFSDQGEVNYGYTNHITEALDLFINVQRLTAGREFYTINPQAIQIPKEDYLLTFPNVSIYGKEFIAKNQWNKVKFGLPKDMIKAALEKLKIKDFIVGNPDKAPPTKRVRNSKYALRGLDPKHIKEEKVATLRDFQLKMLPKFMRNTTTNFRFDLMGTGAQTNQDTENTFQNKQTFTRQFSGQFALQDPNLDQPKGTKLLQVANEFILSVKLMRGITGAPLKEKIKVFGVIPSKSELEKTQKALNDLDIKFHDQVTLDEALNGLTARLWRLVIRYLTALELKDLYSLKKYLVLDVKPVGSTQIKDILYVNLTRIFNFVEIFNSRMDEIIRGQYSDIKVDICKLLVRQNLAQGRWGSLFEQIYKKFLKTASLIHLEKINYEAVRTATLEFYETNENQGVALAVRVNKSNAYADYIESKLESQMGLTINFWSHITDVITQCIKKEREEQLQSIMNNREQLNALTVNGITTDIGLSKAFSLGFLKLILGEKLVNSVMKGENEEEQKKQMDNFLFFLLDSPKRLPLFVYFIQSLNQSSGDYKKSEGIGYSAIDKFIERYMTLSPNESIQEMQFFPNRVTEYTNSKDRIVYLISKRRAEDFVAELTKFKFDKSFSPKSTNEPWPREIWRWSDEPKKLTPELLEFFLVIINEFFLQFSLEKPADIIEDLRFVVESQLEQIKAVFPNPFYRVLISLVTNFEDFPALRISPGESELSINQKILSIMWLLRLTDIINTDHIFYLDGKIPIEQREQVVALPTEEEEEGKVLAQIIYQKQTGMLDVTSLNECECGYRYFIGNCGKPNAEAKCPQCGVVIGGTSHNYANAKNKIISLEEFMKEYSEKESRSGQRYVVRDPSNLDDNMVLRHIGGPVPFKVIEMLTHMRYLWEFYFRDSKSIQGLVGFLNVKGTESDVENTIDYLMRLVAGDIGSIARSFKSEKKAIYFLKLLLEDIDMRYIGYSTKTEGGVKMLVHISRNTLEWGLFGVLKRELGSADSDILNRTNKVKETEASGLGCKKLVYDWVSKLASVSDFANNEMVTDLRVVTGLRLENEVNLDNLREMIDLKHPELEELSLLKFAINHNALLTVFGELFNHHIELSEHLMSKLDSSISWAEACQLSIRDLTSSDESHIIDESLQHLVDKFGRDKELDAKFAKLSSDWNKIILLRDQFPEAFDFRFLCHGTALPEATILETTDPARAKVAFFLVDEKHVESLFMASVLQTFSKFQNETIKRFKEYFFKINGHKPFTEPVQQMQRSQLIGLECGLEELIRRYSIKNSKFNKETEILFDLKLIDSQLAQNLFFGKALCGFEDKLITNMVYSLNFNATAANVARISSAVKQTALETNQVEFISDLLAQDPVEVFTQLSKMVRRNLPRVQFGAIYPLDTEEGEELVEAVIKLGQVRAVYELVELANFLPGVELLEPVYNLELEEGERSLVEALVNTLEKGQLGLLVNGVKRMVLRQLVGCANEQIGCMALKEAIEYSDCFDGDNSVDDRTLEAVPAGITLNKAASFVLAITKEHL